tara:strand:- start:236 stop:487 length:252 start_codon:yes stop_codon:yes gene_type:complete
MKEEENNLNNEVLTLVKMLVEKIEKLEQKVYDADNVLMKSGLIKVDSPKPVINNNPSGVPDSNSIAKMSWDDINKLVTQMEGN